MRHIGALTPESVRVERSTSNTPLSQKEYIQAQSEGHARRSNMTSLSLADMYIHFTTLTFHNRSEKQLQERLRLKKSTT
jgi:hypothetical protein